MPVFSLDLISKDYGPSRPVRTPLLLLLFMAALLPAGALSAASDAESPDSLSVVPTSATVGEVQTLTFTLTVGSNGFNTNGVASPFVQIDFPAAQRTTGLQMTPPQEVNPNALGYITGCPSSDGINCDTNGIMLRAEHSITMAVFTLEGGALPEGHHLIMTYRGRMRKNAGTIVWKYRTDRNADGLLEPPEPKTYFAGPEFTFEGADPAYIQLTAPADPWVNTNGCDGAGTNGCFDLALVAFDQWANRASPASVIVHLSGSDLVGLPAEPIDFSTNAIQLVPNLRYTSPGFHRIAGTTTNGIPVFTHYSYVHAQRPTYRRFFGDTHFHTGSGGGNPWSPAGDHRRGYTYADQAYDYVRNVARLDFASLSEHCASGQCTVC